MPTIEEHRQAILCRLVAACQTDERVVAAFLGGSYAREATDAHSNLDFGLIRGCRSIGPENRYKAHFPRLKASGKTDK